MNPATSTLASRPSAFTGPGPRARRRRHGVAAGTNIPEPSPSRTRAPTNSHRLRCEPEPQHSGRGDGEPEPEQQARVPAVRRSGRDRPGHRARRGSWCPRSGRARRSGGGTRPAARRAGRRSRRTRAPRTCRRVQQLRHALAATRDADPSTDDRTMRSGTVTEMRYGVTMFMTDQTMGPVELAREVEERGLYSLYLPEHTHIPTSRRTPPPTGDAELREEYKRTLDPFVALAMAAAVDRATPGRHRHLPRRATRPDRDRQGDRDARSAVGRPLRARHRLRLERRRDRAPRRHDEATGATSPASTCSRCARCGATTSAEFRRRVRAHRAVVVVAEAGAQPRRAADAHRRRGRAEAVRARRRVRRRVDPDRWPRRPRRAARTCTRRARPIGRDPATLRIVPFGTVPDAGKLEYYASIGIDEIVLRLPGGDADRCSPSSTSTPPSPTLTHPTRPCFVASRSHAQRTADATRGVGGVR